MTDTQHRQDLSLLQWNCHGLINKKEALTQIANFDILALSETWLSAESNFSLKNFHIIRYDGPSNRSGGTLLAVRDWVPFSRLDSVFFSMGTFEAVEISIPSPISNNPLHIISIYRHPGHFESQLWSRFINSLPSSSHILITGDFNAHHPDWGCRSADAVGLSLLEVTQENSLFPINDGRATFIFRPHLTSSAIDITCLLRSFSLLHLERYGRLTEQRSYPDNYSPQSANQDSIPLFAQIENFAH